MLFQFAREGERKTCRSERDEEAALNFLCLSKQILRYAQDDKQWRLLCWT